MKCYKMLHNSFNSTSQISPPSTIRGEREGCRKLVLWQLPFHLFLSCTAALAVAGCGGGSDRPKIDYTPPPVAAPITARHGAIFHTSSYAPLISGNKAVRVGDILTVVLSERTTATKSNSASSSKDGSIGLTPPATGPLALFSPSDATISGGQSFKGSGKASQSNALSGTITVTVTHVQPGGVMRISGEKLIRLNRGDERIQLSGLVRQSDVTQDNRVSSALIADANIAYFGKGEIAQASRQGWLQRFFSIVSPF